MAPQSLALGALLVLVAVGQVPRGAVTAATSESESESTSVLIFGQVPCSNGTSIDATQVPPFPNAKVNLMCGNGKMMGTATTNAKGSFFTRVNNVQKQLVADLRAGKCRAVVTTPLVECNPLLVETTQKLSASLQVVGERTKVVGTSILEDLIIAVADVFSALFG